MSRFALLREQGTCSHTYTKIIEIPLCERWVPVAERTRGVVQRPGGHMSLTWFYHVSQQVSTHVHGQGIVPIETSCNAKWSSHVYGCVKNHFKATCSFGKSCFKCNAWSDEASGWESQCQVHPIRTCHHSPMIGASHPLLRLQVICIRTWMRRGRRAYLSP